MSLTVRMLNELDAAVFERIADGVFDGAVDSVWSAEFLADARHHLAAAIDGDTLVGITSAVHYVHPDKAAQLFINEVAVAPTHHGRGIGRQLFAMILEHGRALGCEEAWVLTDDAENAAAHRLYASSGGRPTPAGSVTMYSFPLEPRP